MTLTTSLFQMLEQQLQCFIFKTRIDLCIEFSKVRRDYRRRQINQHLSHHLSQPIHLGI